MSVFSANNPMRIQLVSFKGVFTEKEIQNKYRELATAVLMQGTSTYPEILAVDKVSRHLNNLKNQQYLLPVKR